MCQAPFALLDMVFPGDETNAVAGLRTHNQKMTVAAMAIALMKARAQRSYLAMDPDLARISHTPCALRRLKRPAGQESGAGRTGSTAKPFDAACRPLQPALWVALRRPPTGAGHSTVWPDTLFASRAGIRLAAMRRRAQGV